MNVKYYINIVLRQPLPFWQYLLGIQLESLFMQDGAHAHTTKTYIVFLEEHRIILYNHPSYSSNLNPI